MANSVSNFGHDSDKGNVPIVSELTLAPSTRAKIPGSSFVRFSFQIGRVAPAIVEVLALSQSRNVLTKGVKAAATAIGVVSVKTSIPTRYKVT